MYTFEFEVLTSDLTISVFGEDYKEAIDKIREMNIPDLKKGHLRLVSVFESYEDAMYMDAGLDDVKDVDNTDDEKEKE
jgi:hypothetical protein